jgi:hypothetical protein
MNRFEIASTVARLNIVDLAVFRLSSMAGCSTPDSPDSAGADLLNRVRTGFLEALDNYADLLEDVTAADDIRSTLDTAEHETADGAPSVMTYPKWQQFVDLEAYQVNAADYLGGGIEDMGDAATTHLYVIGRVWFAALVDMYADDLGDALDVLDEVGGFEEEDDDEN